MSSRQLPPLLRRRGWEMIVVTGHHHLDLPDEDALEDIRIFRFPFAAAFTQHDLGRIVRIRRQVAELKHDFKPDIVHLNLVGPSALMDARTTGPVRTPTLMSVHTQPSDGALASGTLYRSVLSSADWITACSDAVLQEARSQAPEIVPRSSVAYLGLAMPDLVPARLPYEVPRILCVGRLVPRKGFDLAIRAFAGLAGRFTTARLVIAGGGTLRPELEALGRELKVDDRVQFLGWVDPDDIPSLINSATLVLIPSWSEGLPLVACQAWITG